MFGNWLLLASRTHSCLKGDQKLFHSKERHFEYNWNRTCVDISNLEDDNR